MSLSSLEGEFKMTKFTLRVIDFETTGFPDEENPQCVVEIGFVDADAKTKLITDKFSSLVKPTTEMTLGAQAIHHISYEEASQNGIEWVEAQKIATKRAEDEIIIFVAHNADFEKKFFNPEGSIWLDTYKVALKLYPDAPSHSNQVLKYFLGVENKDYHHPPHRALPDCCVTFEILQEMAKEISINEMVKISNNPPYLTKIPFGKHRGEKFEDLPDSYINWLSSQDDLDEGVKYAIDRLRS